MRHSARQQPPKGGFFSIDVHQAQVWRDMYLGLRQQLVRNRVCQIAAKRSAKSALVLSKALGML